MGKVVAPTYVEVFTHMLEDWASAVLTVAADIMARLNFNKYIKILNIIFTDISKLNL